MAERPIFIPAYSEGKLYKSVPISFNWNPGFAPSQKLKNVHALHRSARKIGFDKILEVSTKSEEEIGRRLSAFRLKVRINNCNAAIENIFQGSKIFENGGPFHFLYNVSPLEAKRYTKNIGLGKIIGFEIDGVRYGNYPFHAFYDWLFINSLRDHVEFLRNRVFEYDAFSDIEFNPSKSINTQARTMAIITSLIHDNILDKSAESYEFYRDRLLQDEVRHANSQV